MIITALFGGLVAVLRGILGAILPVGGSLGLTIPEGWFQGYAWVDGMVAVHVAFQVAAALVALRLALAAAGGALMIWHAIRG